MARKKRSSQVLKKAIRRAASMGSIDSNLNLGNDLTLFSFLALINTLQTKENAYNSALSNLDKLYQEMLDTERQLGDMAEHMLMAVATRYGKSSVEYGMAGGVPKNQRRRGLRGESLTTPQSPPTVNVSHNGYKAMVDSPR